VVENKAFGAENRKLALRNIKKATLTEGYKFAKNQITFYLCAIKQSFYKFFAIKNHV
jgi:hypothetical protein